MFNTIKVNNTDTDYTHSIFDISDYNSGATYNDLSAALAAIPESKLHGGMTVCYVLTDDHKYVQFRLMPDTFSITESDWQGVDDIPTAGSDNLVKSDGVSKCIYEQIASSNAEDYVDCSYDDPIIAGFAGGIGKVTASDTRILFTIPLVDNGTNKIKIDVASGYKYFIYGYSELYHNLKVGDTVDVSKQTYESSAWLTSEQTIQLSDTSKSLLVLFAKSDDSVLSLDDLNSSSLSLKAKLHSWKDDVANFVGAFDLSAYNSGATYQNLADALSGTHVPAYIRRGGMSVMYKEIIPATYTVVKTEGLDSQPSGTAMEQDPNINSGTYTASQLSSFSSLPTTSNSSLTYYLAISSGGTTTYTTWVITKFTNDSVQYVQYRLMNTSWSVVTSDWQGVDEEPLAGSNNLVKSEGVSKYVYEQIASSNAEGYVDCAYDDQQIAGFNNVSGAVTASTTRMIFTIPLVENGTNEIKVDVASGYKYFIVAFSELYHNPEVGSVLDVSKLTYQSSAWVSSLQAIQLPETTKSLVVLFAKSNDAVISFDELNPNTLSVKAKLYSGNESNTDFSYKIDNTAKCQDFAELFKDAAGEVETFIFFSDIHCYQTYNSPDMTNIGKEALNSIFDYFNNTPTNFVLSGGDWLTNHKQSVAIKALANVDGYMNKFFGGLYFPIYGNHDNNYQGELDETTDKSANDGALTNQQMVNLWFRKWGKMYYTFLGTASRFYVFDSGIDFVTEMDTYKWGQVDWFANQLLQNTDTHIILATHIAEQNFHDPSAFGNNITPVIDYVLQIAEAFNARTSITLNGITYDFSQKTGKIHCMLCGHLHFDATGVVHNIPLYCITTTSVTVIFDMIFVDYGSNKLKSVRVGTGSNREINLA